MNPISALCFAAAAFIGVLSMRRGSDVLSPARVFGFVWCVAIGLANLKLSAFQHVWTLEEWCLVLLGPVSLLVGLLVAYVAHADGRLMDIGSMRSEWRVRAALDHGRLFWAVCAAFAFYALGYLIIYWVKGFIPMFSLLPGALRGEFTLFGLGVSVHTMPAIVFFTSLYCLSEHGRRGRKIMLAALSIVSIVTFFFLLQRFQLIMTAIMCTTLLYYTSRLVKTSTLLILAAVGAFAFYEVSTLRSGQLFIQYLYTESKMRFPREYAALTEPYMYIVMNLENLARAASRVDQHTYGFFTFDFITALTGLKHWVEEYFALKSTPYLVSGYNTYTAYWTYYRDFGVLGISLIPFALGAGVGTVYYRMRNSGEIRLIAAYSLLLFVIVISFFNSPFGFLWFMWTVFLTLVMFRVSRARPRTTADRVPA